MFEITRDDIAALDDEDLRTLIGLLCEAELRRANLPVSAVTWGGNQTAKDGGLDVRVSLPPGPAIAGFIPRVATGFQIKKPDNRPPVLNLITPAVLEVCSARPASADTISEYTSAQVLCCGANQAHSNP